MKDLMAIINSVISLGSVLGIIWHIISGQFGIAWIATACAAFSYCNAYAIDEE